MTFIYKILLFSCSLVAANNLSAQGIAQGDHTKNAGKVEWLNRQIRVGEIPQGVPITREFLVKNISKEPLLITEVHTGCHCTTAEFTKDPIKKGETATIRVTFDAQISGDFYKLISIKTNFDPQESVAVVLTGKVLPKGN